LKAKRQKQKAKGKKEKRKAKVWERGGIWMNYSEWEATVPESMKVDSVWTVTAYRRTMFLGIYAGRM